MQIKTCQVFKPISISLSPNIERDDIWLALKLIFKPWKWKKDRAIEELENQFKNYLGVKYAFSFNSGRSAFLAILKSLGLGSEKEVLLQAFTCNAAANPIIWAGLNPVYVDCDENDFNIDVEDLKRKITPKSKIVVVQHTFGLPANISEVLEICQQNNLILIEDCAHSLGAKYRGKKIGLSVEASAKVGTFGKAAFFSFSRDKVISSVYGGIAVTNDPSLAEKLQQTQDKFKHPSCCWVLQQLCHPPFMQFKVLPFYNFFKIGKIILILSQKLHILSKAVHWKEKRGKMPSYFSKKMPNALALLALNQFKKLDRFNEHRKEIAKFYFKNLSPYNSESRFSSGARGSYFENLRGSDFELPQIPAGREHIFLRFTVKHPNAHQIIKMAWKKNLLIGDWYTSPVAPDDTKLDALKYKLGSCPKAEKLSKITLNLPTHINISKNKAQKIIDFLKTF